MSQQIVNVPDNNIELIREISSIHKTKDCMAANNETVRKETYERNLKDILELSKDSENVIIIEKSPWSEIPHNIKVIAKNATGDIERLHNDLQDIVYAERSNRKDEFRRHQAAEDRYILEIADLKKDLVEKSEKCINLQNNLTLEKSTRIQNQNKFENLKNAVSKNARLVAINNDIFWDEVYNEEERKKLSEFAKRLESDLEDNDNTWKIFKRSFVYKWIPKSWKNKIESMYRNAKYTTIEIQDCAKRMQSVVDKARRLQEKVEMELQYTDRMSDEEITHVLNRVA